MRPLRLCWKYLRRYWGNAFLALVAMIMQTTMDLLVPWPLKIIFDNVLGEFNSIFGPPGKVEFA